MALSQSDAAHAFSAIGLRPLLERIAGPNRICPPIRPLLLLNAGFIPVYLLITIAFYNDIVRMILLLTSPILLFGYILVSRVNVNLWKTARGSVFSWLLYHLVLLLASALALYLLSLLLKF